jgi:hypothetical protein
VSAPPDAAPAAPALYVTVTRGVAAVGLTDALAAFARSVVRLRPSAGEDRNDALLVDYGGRCDVLEAASAGRVRRRPRRDRPDG